MALQFAAFPPRHGILLNPSPSSSPYAHETSLPGTPRLLSSLSSLSSSTSSNSPNTSDADNYFLTYASAKDTLAAPRGGSSQLSQPPVTSQKPKKTRPTSAPSHLPHPRRIRFAPLPEPRRDEDMDLPEVFLNDSQDNLSSFPHDSFDNASRSAPSSRASSRPSSLLLGGVVSLDQSPSDCTPTLSTTTLNGAAGPSGPISISAKLANPSDRGDYDWDLCLPTSPATTISSLGECGSCPESPASRRLELPREKERGGWSKFLKPFRPRSNTSEGTTRGRDSDDAMSSGANTPAGARSRSRSRERSGSSAENHDTGAPLGRVTSETTHHKKRKSSFLSSLGAGGSTESGLWRTQSATGDLRRVKSKEADDLRRVRSGSGSGYPGPRVRQLRMLNGRVYGAKRGHNNVNLFASARSEDPEFVEWGYGGMGSVKSAASTGADVRWSRVTGRSALGSGEAGWGTEKSRGRAATDDDDGSGLAWVKRRREQREREKKEQEAAAKEEAAAEESPVVEMPQADAADPDPPKSEENKENESKEEGAMAIVPEEKPVAVAVVEEPEHVTTAVAVPISRPSSHGHHRSMSSLTMERMERAPSFSSHHSSHIIRTMPPERRGSADTARAASPPMSVHTLPGAEQVVEVDEELDMDDDNEPRERRQSESSGTSTSTEDDGDGDADTEESPKEGEEDEDEEEDEIARRTALSAGVEKISRHKEKAHSQDGGSMLST